MSRQHDTVRRASHSPLVIAGWLFAFAMPFIGIALGAVALRREPRVRAQGLLIVAVSLVGSLLWCLILTGSDGRELLLTS